MSEWRTQLQVSCTLGIADCMHPATQRQTTLGCVTVPLTGLPADRRGSDGVVGVIAVATGCPLDEVEGRQHAVAGEGGDGAAVVPGKGVVMQVQLFWHCYGLCLGAWDARVAVPKPVTRKRKGCELVREPPAFAPPRAIEGSAPGLVAHDDAAASAQEVLQRGNLRVGVAVAGVGHPDVSGARGGQQAAAAAGGDEQAGGAAQAVPGAAGGGHKAVAEGRLGGRMK